MTQFPEWLQQNDEYSPQSDRDSFLTKSLLSLMGVLKSFRAKTSSYGSNYPAPLKLIVCLGMIILTTCAHNMVICYAVLAVLMIHICFLNREWLVRTISIMSFAALLSAVLLVPSIFLGSPQSMLTVSIKVFITVGLVGLLAATTEWNKITAGLAAFHVPNIFIFTLDITLKYIVILGDVSVDMLNALKLRSVGRNRSKAQSLSGILGVTFMKSKQMSEEMHQAMVCRGFEGEYRKNGK